ncbi:MAG: hypothetical protein IKW30_00315 [Lachnospiraceae bacterium]|nr:hypothetical protein [Lachnospiraceae bacterium]
MGKRRSRRLVSLRSDVYAALYAPTAGIICPFHLNIALAENVPGFIDCAGIESPGLSSCPAIGKYIANFMKEKMDLKEKENFVKTRKGILNLAKLSIEERNELIKELNYGNKKIASGMYSLYDKGTFRKMSARYGGRN